MPEQTQLWIELVSTLYGFSTVADETDRNAALTEAISIGETLEREHRMPSEMRNWVGILKSKLAPLH